MRRSVKSIVLGTACACALVTSALAQTNAVDISSGDLKSAIDKYAQQTGVQVIYNPDDLVGRKTAGVHGSVTPDQAIGQLLAGTDLTPKREPGGAIGIAKADQPKNVQAASNEAARKPSSDIESVTVTGTLVRGAAPASPLLVIDRSDIDREGYSTIAAAVQSLPQNFSGGQSESTYGASGTLNSGNFGFISGANLRGLGSDSTLVLIDGRRLAPSGTQDAVDLSIVPLGAVQRIEILTDGASAIYGSDAVAGVVNIITKKGFSGLETTADIGTARGGDSTERYALDAGYTWGSGNAFVSLESFYQHKLDAGQRSFSSSSYLPQDLIPQVNKFSSFGSFNQSLLPWLEVSGDALFADRVTTSILGASTYYGTSPIRVTQLNYDLQFKATLPGDWIATLSGAAGSDRVHSKNNYFFRPATPYISNESILGNNINYIETSANGSLFELPGGSVMAALGGGYRWERYEQTIPGNATVTGHTLGRRQAGYGYFEVVAPLVSAANAIPGIQQLSLTVDGRYESYTDAGSRFSPKVGIVYSPLQDFTIKGTYGSSFHAPALNSINQYSYSSLYDLPDPTSARGTSLGLVTGGGNTNLKPETATEETVSLGYASADSPFSINVTYYDIAYDNRILAPIQTLAPTLTTPAYAPLVTRNPSAAVIQSVVNSSAIFSNYSQEAYPGTPVAVLVTNDFQNLATYEVSGVDVTARYHLDTALGPIDLHGNLAQISQLTFRLSASAPQAEIANTIFSPAKTRLGLGGTWGFSENWSASANMHFTGSYTDNVATPARPVSSWTTFDAQVAYDFAKDLGWFTNDLRVSVSALNIFDQDPPAIAPTSTLGNREGYDATNASPVGRFVSLRITKSW